MKEIILAICGVFLSSTLLAYGDLNKKLKGNFCEDFCKNAKAVDLSSIRTPYANLRGGNFSCVNYSKAVLNNVNFSNATLICTNFSGADLSFANFDNANLLGVNLLDANLSNAHAKSKLSSKTSYTDKEVHHFYTINKYGIQGLYLHGRDLSNGDIENNIQMVKISD